MKIRNRHFESCVYKNVLEPQSSWNTNRAHLPNWTSFGTHIYSAFCCGPPNLDKLPAEHFQLFEVMLQNTGYNSASGGVVEMEHTETAF
ncbi:hypothetical protein AVEN_44998-1 [Araneus ventricosus]|uniref:Uncharacterized protein n=1 Tax=Araneus ventricosus TaxID=182803 RepID=A0A4Y2K077_ARAVE|nr:hypothetical protein AVEN_44998-1 [Araneus ventricosus]